MTHQPLRILVIILSGFVLLSYTYAYTSYTYAYIYIIYICIEFSLSLYICVCVYVCVYIYIYIILWYSLYAATDAAKSLQLCLTLWDPVDGSPPGSAIPGILQARTLEWVAIAFSDSLYECTIIYVINLYLWAFRLLLYFPYKYYS